MLLSYTFNMYLQNNCCVINLGERDFKSASIKKKLMIYMARPLRIGFIRHWMESFVYKDYGKDTDRYGFFFGRTRFRTTITPKNIYGNPQYLPFEDAELHTPEHYHEYLTQMFGDYMKLPPVDQQRGRHLISVDFGQY